jgi:hypothetical protein
VELFVWILRKVQAAKPRKRGCFSQSCGRSLLSRNSRVGVSSTGCRKKSAQLKNPVLRIANAKGFAKPCNEAYREKYEVIGTRYFKGHNEVGVCAGVRALARLPNDADASGHSHAIFLHDSPGQTIPLCPGLGPSYNRITPGGVAEGR